MRIWIVEDEVTAANRIEKIILELKKTWLVEKKIDSCELLFESLKNEPHPDLIFSDIQLGDGISFTVYEKYKTVCPIIFTTAYNDYATEAFAANGLHYLLKPINRGELAAAIEKFETLGNQLNSTLFHALPELHNLKSQKSFLFKLGTRLYPIRDREIAYFVNENKIVIAVLFDGKKLPANKSLEELEKIVDGELFFRINRQCIVGRNAISKIQISFGSKLKIDTLPNFGEDLIVSRERASDFKAWLEN